MNVVDTLDAHLRTFDLLVGRSERLLTQGRLERAAASARVAATYAWCNHTGLFASDRLERLLDEIGGRLAGDGPLSSPAPDRVLHVVTQAYPTGGHTQMLANWIATDTDREHHLCLTHQTGRAFPDKVRAVVDARRTTVLDEHSDTLTGRARALRGLAGGFGTVVLHIHPNDVVPSIALARGAYAGSQVLLVNHADHVFWVGLRAADRVVNLRRSGAELSLTRRGVPEDRNEILIRPLDLRPRHLSREQAKAELGVPSDTILLASGADAGKYEPVEGLGFVDLVEPVLADRQAVTLRVAGPAPQGRWQSLEADGHGRALGLLDDIRTLLEACDVYLDSYPFSSLTSMLEAGSLGTPVMTLQARSDEPAVLGADTPELEGLMVVADTADDYRHELTRLLGDDEARGLLGKRTEDAVRGAHTGSAWRDAVSSVFGGPEAPRGPAGSAPAVRRTGRLDQRVALVQQAAGGQGVRGSTAVNAQLLPLRQRLLLVASMLRHGERPRPSLLLPVRWARRLRKPSA